jgi:hypothetical protein
MTFDISKENTQRRVRGRGLTHAGRNYGGRCRYCIEENTGTDLLRGEHDLGDPPMLGVIRRYATVKSTGGEPVQKRDGWANLNPFRTGSPLFMGASGGTCKPHEQKPYLQEL